VALLLAIEALVLVLRYLLSDLATSAPISAVPSAVSAAWAEPMRLPQSRASAPDAPAAELRALPAQDPASIDAVAEAEDGPSAGLRAQVEQLWRVRERDGDERLIGTHLARELGTPARHIQAVLRELRTQPAPDQSVGPEDQEGSS
jgi:hypothetical protein